MENLRCVGLCALRDYQTPSSKQEGRPKWEKETVFGGTGEEGMDEREAGSNNDGEHGFAAGRTWV